VKVADTVGAGDTFTAGFLAHLQRNGLLTKKAFAALDDAALADAGTFAMKAAAVTVSRPGANPPWTREMA
jgi:fructokinase